MPEVKHAERDREEYAGTVEDTEKNLSRKRGGEKDPKRGKAL